MDDLLASCQHKNVPETQPGQTSPTIPAEKEPNSRAYAIAQSEKANSEKYSVLNKYTVATETTTRANTDDALARTELEPSARRETGNDFPLDVNIKMETTGHGYNHHHKTPSFTLHVEDDEEYPFIFDNIKEDLQTRSL